jgi:hypothetical protein
MKSTPAKLEFENRIQRIQKAIAGVPKNLPADLLSEETITKVAAFLTAQVEEMRRELLTIQRTGVKRGVFSLDAPAEDKIPGYDEPKSPVPPPPRPAPPPQPPADEPKHKVTDVMGKVAPPDVAKEVLKTAEDAPERVRVFGSKPAAPVLSEGDIEFFEE